MARTPRKARALVEQQEDRTEGRSEKSTEQDSDELEAELVRG